MELSKDSALKINEVISKTCNTINEVIEFYHPAEAVKHLPDMLKGLSELLNSAKGYSILEDSETAL